MISDNLWRCRVCGLKQEDLPWEENGTIPSFNICSCCGAEFGYEDFTLSGIRRYRKEWLEKKKAQWWRPKMRPNDWSLEDQLKNIPQEFM